MIEHPRTIPFVEALRGFACLLVVYCHVIAGRADHYKYDWPPYVAISDYVVAPLGVIQDFGFFGVALFFVISGFIISHTAQREDRRSFLIKRVARIYPALFVAVATGAMVYALNEQWTGVKDPSISLAPLGLVHNLLGVNALFNSSGALVVAWTLTIELVFYAHVLVVLPLLRRSALWACTFFIVWPSLLIWITLHVGFRQLGALSLFIPVFAMGMAIYFAFRGRLRPRVAMLLCGLAWVAMVYNLRTLNPSLIVHPTSYTSQVGYVVAVFVGAMWAWQTVRENPRWVRFFADISYSLYLLHYPFGVLAMDHLYPQVGFTVAVILSLALVFGLSWLSVVWVERPAQRLARRLADSRHLPLPAAVQA